MRTSRLEAFSDGVMAIIITIMVLELKVPEGHDLHALRERPATGLLTYVLSFVYIGIYWNNHHHMFQLVDRVDGAVLWANLALLFCLSLYPFTTAWMDETELAPHPGRRVRGQPARVRGRLLRAAAGDLPGQRAGLPVARRGRTRPQGQGLPRALRRSASSAQRSSTCGWASRSTCWSRSCGWSPTAGSSTTSRSTALLEALGPGCRRGGRGWGHAPYACGRASGARAAVAPDARLVRGRVRGSHGGPGGRLAGGRRRPGRTRRRPDRLRQDAGRVPLVPRPGRHDPGAGEPAPSLPDPLHLAAQGPRGRRRAQPARHRSPASGRPRDGSAPRCPTSGSPSAPATPPPTSAVGSPASRPTCSSPRPSRSSCCSPGSPARPCAASRRSSSTRSTRSPAPSAAPTWRCPSSASTRCSSARPGGSGCRRPSVRWSEVARVPRRHPRRRRRAAALGQDRRARGRRAGPRPVRARHVVRRA